MKKKPKTLGDVWERLEHNEKIYLLKWLNHRRACQPSHIEVYGSTKLDMATLPFVTVKEAVEVGFFITTSAAFQYHVPFARIGKTNEDDR